MLDTCDFRPMVKLPEFGAYGQVHALRKSKRGGGPAAPHGADWAVEVIERYLVEVRPSFGCPEHPAVFLTERGTRIAVAYINERFAEIRDEAGLQGS